MVPITLKTIDLDKPEFPRITIPKWHTPEIQQLLNGHLAFMKEQKQAPIREIFDLYAYQVEIFNKTKKVFTDKKMKPIWEKLNSLSKEKAENFASKILFQIENQYDGGLTLIEKHRAEIISCEKMIEAAQKLYDEMENYAYWFYGHMIQENHNDLMDTLSEFVENTTDSLKQFKEHIKSDSYMFCDIWPINRQNRAKNSLSIFYMRKIYLIFMKSFGIPMYASIAEIVNVIFNTDYSENQAIKHCASVRPLLCDNSNEK